MATVMPAGAQLVYYNDFSSSAGTEWTKQTISFTPAGARGFLGAFGEESVRLTLTNLPPHPAISVELTLFVIGGWDGVGDGSPNAPDLWSLTVIGGPTLIHTTFSNTSALQSFPGNYPQVNPARTGAVENNTLGYRLDSVYQLKYTFVHTAPTLRLLFSGATTEPDELWGIDEIRVVAVPEPTTAATILIGGALLVLRHRRRR